MDRGKYNIWKPDYAVAVDEIDMQHKQFFDYCAQLIQLADESHCSRHVNSDLIKLFFNIRAYAFIHFMHEESLMRKYAYPKISDHIQEHNRYIVQFFTKIEKEYNVFYLEINANMDDESRRIARFLSDFAAGWLEHHIYTWDKALGQHINITKR